MKLLNTGITDLLIVPIHDPNNKIDSFEVDHDKDGIVLMIFSKGSDMADYIDLPEGYNYTVLGRALDIDEELCQDILPRKSPYSGLIMFKYLDYESPKGFRFDTATESFHSLLKANGILLENPYPDPKKKLSMCRDCADEDGTCPNYGGRYCDPDLRLDQWKKAQSKVSNPLILKAEPLTKDIDPEIQKVIDDKFWDMI